MSVQADQIKAHAVDRLDREAAVHPNRGHQNVHARRYLMPRVGRPGVEIMIIVKGSSLQLWCEAEAINRKAASSLGGELRSGSETYQPDKDGKIQYSRHSGLKTMDRLHRGDAWHFVPRTIGDLDKILDATKASMVGGFSP